MSHNSPTKFTQVSVGKKILMAITGLSVVGFLIVHLLGNLQIFIGQEQLNQYAETLQNMGALKWGFRGLMIILFGIHIWKGIVLWLENKQARPVSYVKDETMEASIASRTMIWTGAVILSFVIYHLLHFTLIVSNPEYANLPPVDGRFDVYSMVIAGFQNVWISTVYIIALFLMSFHLSHAAASMFQTFGVTTPKMLKLIKNLSNLLAVIIFCAYVSIPVAVLMGFIGGGN